MRLITLIVDCIAEWLSSFIIGLLTLITVLNVLLRYIAHMPLVWAEEVQILALAWVIMLGATYAKKTDSIMRIDAICAMLPQRGRKFLFIVQELVQCVVLCLLIFYGYHLAEAIKVRPMPILGISMFWFYLALPVGACALLVASLSHLFKGMRTGGDE